MMQIRKKLIQASRRGFLRKSALLGGAAVAAPQLAQASESQSPTLEAEVTGAKGYRKTEHVAAYYKRARF